MSNGDEVGTVADGGGKGTSQGRTEVRIPSSSTGDAKGSLEELELAILGAELLKLEKETTEIELRNQKEKRALEKQKNPVFYDQYVDFLKLIPVYLSVGVTLLLAMIQTGTYLTQRSDQIANQANAQLYELDSKMIDISETLVNGSNEAQQRIAALQLAAFGLPAVGILLEYLDLGLSDELVGTTARSLTAIAEGRGDFDAVLGPVQDISQEIVNRELDRALNEGDVSFTSIGNYVSVLATITSNAIRSLPDSEAAILCKEVLETFDTLLEGAEGDFKARVIEEDRLYVTQLLKDEIAELSTGGACHDESEG